MSPLDLWAKALNVAASARALLERGAMERLEATNRFLDVLTALKERAP